MSAVYADHRTTESRPLLKKVYIIARTSHHADRFAQKILQLSSREYQYVQQLDYLRGMNDITIYRLSGWSDGVNYLIKNDIDAKLGMYVRLGKWTVIEMKESHVFDR